MSTLDSAVLTNLNGSIWIYSVCTAEEPEHSLLLCTHRGFYRFGAFVPSCSVTQAWTQQPIKGSSSGHRLAQGLFVQMEQGRSASFDNFWLPAILEAADKKKNKQKKEYSHVKMELLAAPSGNVSNPIWIRQKVNGNRRNIVKITESVREWLHTVFVPIRLFPTNSSLNYF